ncbi:MAG: hypothetical protein ACI9KE_000930, partial [Polyangiales bacterium]
MGTLELHEDSESLRPQSVAIPPHSSHASARNYSLFPPAQCLRFVSPMHDDPSLRDAAPSGDGPYRRSARKREPKRSRRKIYVALSAVGVLVAAFFFFREPEKQPAVAALGELSLPEARPLATFPMASTLLPEATPLSPLLAADAPEHLAILRPSPGVQRLSRNDTLRVQFNRPMVQRSAIGDELERSPIVLRAGGRTVAGSARWVSRSVVVFNADGRAWDRNLEAQLGVRADLRSLDGSALLDERERVVVFDGT